MSPFMSSMPAAGLIEMPPVSKATPLPTSAERRRSGLPPFHLQDRQPRRADRALRHGQQSSHAERLHVGIGQDLDLDAERRKFARRRRQFDRTEDIGRGVDEFAGEQDAFDRGHGSRRVRASTAAGSATARVTVSCPGSPFSSSGFAPRLVAVEAVVPQLQAGGEFGNGFGRLLRRRRRRSAPCRPGSDRMRAITRAALLATGERGRAALRCGRQAEEPQSVDLESPAGASSFEHLSGLAGIADGAGEPRQLLSGRCQDRPRHVSPRARSGPVNRMVKPCGGFGKGRSLERKSFWDMRDACGGFAPAIA